MRIIGLILSFGLISFIGCGGDKGAAGASSPEDLAKSLVGSFGDAAKFKKLLPSEGDLNALMKCEGDKNMMAEQIKKLGEEAEKEFAAMKDIKMEFVSAETKDTKSIKKGEKQGPCEALKDFEVAKIKVKMKMTKGDETKENSEGFRGVKIDGKWYVTDL